MSRPPISESVTFIYTHDLEAGSRFFSEVLELEMVIDQGACHIYRLTEKSFIGICCLPDRQVEPRGVMLTLVTPDVDGWFEFLTSKGLTYERKPQMSDRFKVYSSLLVGPEGYRIEIQQFRDPQWEVAQGTKAQGTKAQGTKAQGTTD